MHIEIDLERLLKEKHKSKNFVCEECGRSGLSSIITARTRFPALTLPFLPKCALVWTARPMIF